jgi:hypothetical protein
LPIMSEAKKPNWVLRFVLIIGGLFAVVITVVGILVYRWAQDPARKEAFAKVMEMGRRPGSAEMRGIGCDHGIVQSSAELEQFVKAMNNEAKLEAPAELLVTCRLEPMNSLEPSCEDVARAYASGDKEHPESFYVQVHRQALPKQKTLCEGIYDAEGTKVKDAKFAN